MILRPMLIWFKGGAQVGLSNRSSSGLETILDQSHKNHFHHICTIICAILWPRLTEQSNFSGFRARACRIFRNSFGLQNNHRKPGFPCETIQGSCLIPSSDCLDLHNHKIASTFQIIYKKNQLYFDLLPLL